MADVKKIRVDIDGNARGLKNATSQANKSLNNLGGSAKKLGGVLAGAFAGTALIAGLGKAVNKMAEFEATMRRVALISKGSEAELSKLAKTLGSTTVFTANQAGEAMTFLAQAGFDANQIMKATPGVLELAASTMMDLASAADIASNVLSAYGMDASELSTINDILVTTTNNANTNVYQFAEAFKVVGPLAKSAGISINEVAGLIGVLGDAGIQGSLAGTQLKRAIAELITPSGEAASILRQLGVETRDQGGQMRSLIEIFDDLGRAGLSTEQSFKIFLDRGATGALVMANAAEKAAILAEKTKEQGVASEQAAKQLDTLKGDIDLLASAWEGLVLEGGKFNSALRETIQFVTWLTGSTAKLLDGQIKLNDEYASLVANAIDLVDIEAQIKALEMSKEWTNQAAVIEQISKALEILNEKKKALTEGGQDTGGILPPPPSEEQTKLFAAPIEALDEALENFIPNLDAFTIMYEASMTRASAPTEALVKVLENLDQTGLAVNEMYKEMAAAANTATNAAVKLDEVQRSQIETTWEAVAATIAQAAAFGSSAKSIISAALAVALAETIKKSMFASIHPIAGLILAGVATAGVKALFNALPEFARGTSFFEGGPALVGERGPEIVNMPRGASVTPNHQLGGGMGGGDIVLKVNEYEFARIINVATANQGNNVARTTF